MLRLFSDITRVFPKKTLLLIYRCIVESHLNYCLEAWGNTYYTRIRSIFTLQKKIIRIIAKVTSLAHSAPLFSYFNILPLPKLIIYNTGKFFFNCVRNRNHTPLLKFFRIDHGIGTRAGVRKLFKIGKSKHNSGKFAFSNRAPEVSNILFSHNCKIDSLSFYAYKFELRTFLFELEMDAIKNFFFSY